MSKTLTLVTMIVGFAIIIAYFFGFNKNLFISNLALFAGILMAGWGAIRYYYRFMNR